MSTFIQDPEKGTLSYYTPEFETRKILPEDYMIDSSDYGPVLNKTAHVGQENGNTERLVPPLEITIGAKTRALVKYHIFYQTTTNAKAKVGLTQSGTATMRSALTGVAPDDTTVTDIYVTSTGFTRNINKNNNHGYVEIDMIVDNDTSTATNINFKFAQYTSHSDPLLIKAGSYVQTLKY